MKTLKRSLILLSSLLVAAPSWAAMQMAISSMDATGYGQNLTSNLVEGWRFSPKEDIVVHELGFFDADANGLARSYKLGIVKPDHTILGSVIVPTGTGGRLDAPFDPAGMLSGSGFRYVALAAPLTLTAGNVYAIAAYITAGTTDPMPFSPAITYATDYLTVSGTGLGGFFDCSLSNVGGCSNSPGIPDLRYPTRFASSGRYVNFSFTPVPVPAALPLLVSGLCLVWGAKRSRSTTR